MRRGLGTTIRSGGRDLAAVWVALAVSLVPFPEASAVGATLAETGPDPVYDQVCMNLAFRHATHGVGMNAHSAKCAAALSPPDYN